MTPGPAAPILHREAIVNRSGIFHVARGPSAGTTARLAIGLGSNVGDRRRNLEFGRAAIARFLEDIRCSSIYETDPRYFRAQRRFLNACVTGRSELDPAETLARLQRIEREAGRREEGRVRYGPRVLDLDLLLYGERVIEREGLRVPHPRMTERAFVLIPLAEIAPRWVHPELGVSVDELADRVSDEGVKEVGDWDCEGG